MSYYIGQRVIVDNEQIATVTAVPKDHRDPLQQHIWVVLHNGVKQWRDKQSVKPLPNGQL
jgi:hypothetical protein